MEDSVTILNRIVRAELEKLDLASKLTAPLDEDQTRILLGVARIISGKLGSDEAPMQVGEALSADELQTLRTLREHKG